jgi:hypothetical protein
MKNYDQNNSPKESSELLPKSIFYVSEGGIEEIEIEDTSPTATNTLDKIVIKKS